VAVALVPAAAASASRSPIELALEVGEPGSEGGRLAFRKGGRRSAAAAVPSAVSLAAGVRRPERSRDFFSASRWKVAVTCVGQDKARRELVGESSETVPGCTKAAADQ